MVATCPNGGGGTVGVSLPSSLISFVYPYLERPPEGGGGGWGGGRSHYPTIPYPPDSRNPARRRRPRPSPPRARPLRHEKPARARDADRCKLRAAETAMLIAREAVRVLASFDPQLGEQWARLLDGGAPALEGLTRGDVDPFLAGDDAEQLGALADRLSKDTVPYTDMGLWGPYGRRQAKVLKFQAQIWVGGVRKL